MTSSEILITHPDCKEWLLSNGVPEEKIVTLHEGPLLPQLVGIPHNSTIGVAIPESWPKEEQDRFTEMAATAMTLVEINRHTINSFKDDWIRNAVFNYEAVMKAKPVDELNEYLTKHKGVPEKTQAVIIGGGPSAGNPEYYKTQPEYLPTEKLLTYEEWKVLHAEYFNNLKTPTIETGIITYAAWSAVCRFDIVADFVGQCDHRTPVGKLNNAYIGIIFTPYASSEFEPSFPKHLRRFVFIDRGNPTCLPFAQKKGIREHNPIAGNVVDMLVQCAIYAGHKKIRLLGVDLCCRTTDELFEYHPESEEARPVSNYNGEVVYTDDIFDIYRTTLENLVKLWPEIEFSMLSPEGSIVEGVPYEPWT